MQEDVNKWMEQEPSKTRRSKPQPAFAESTPSNQPADLQISERSESSGPINMQSQNMPSYLKMTVRRRRRPSEPVTQPKGTPGKGR